MTGAAQAATGHKKRPDLCGPGLFLLRVPICCLLGEAYADLVSVVCPYRYDYNALLVAVCLDAHLVVAYRQRCLEDTCVISQALDHCIAVCVGDQHCSTCQGHIRGACHVERAHCDCAGVHGRHCGGRLKCCLNRGNLTRNDLHCLG